MMLSNKQLDELKDIILTLKEKNDDLTIQLDHLIDKNENINNEKNKILKSQKKILADNKQLAKQIEYYKEKSIKSEKNKVSKSQKKILDDNKQLTKQIEYYKKNYIKKDKKQSKIFNIVLGLIFIIFLLVEIYIFIL